MRVTHGEAGDEDVEARRIGFAVVLCIVVDLTSGLINRMNGRARRTNTTHTLAFEGL